MSQWSVLTATTPPSQLPTLDGRQPVEARIAQLNAKAKEMLEWADVQSPAVAQQTRQTASQLKLQAQQLEAQLRGGDVPPPPSTIGRFVPPAAPVRPPDPYGTFAAGPPPPLGRFVPPAAPMRAPQSGSSFAPAGPRWAPPVTPLASRQEAFVARSRALAGSPAELHEAALGEVTALISSGMRASSALSQVETWVRSLSTGNDAFAAVGAKLGARYLEAMDRENAVDMVLAQNMRPR